MPVATKLIGASGTVPTDGVEETSDDGQDAPTELIALILMLYEVPLLRPLIVNGLKLDAGLRAIQVVPSSVEYS
jgi:hypothetical protein